MRFIDANAGFGGFKPGEREQISAEKLSKMLADVKIESSLVRIVPFENDDNVPYSNEMLYKACASQPNMRPCPVIVPDVLDEFGGISGQIESALSHNAGAVFLRPTVDSWLPEPWVCGELLGALGEVRLPAYVSCSFMKMDTLAKLAGQYPETRFIYSDIGYREMRTLIPLLKHFPNIYITLGYCFNFHYGLETFDKTVGVEHILFGTGLPKSEPGGAMAYLIYSDLTDEKKQAIASGNFENLLKEIKK